MKAETDLNKLRYIPKNALPIEEEGLGVVYVYPFAKKYGAIAYLPKARKASFHYTFKRDVDMDKYIADWFAGLRASKELKSKWKAERSKPHTLQVGDIVTNSWGYDQTNVDWYRVTRTTSHYVWLKPVCSTIEQTGFMSGRESLKLDENLKPIDAEGGKETKHHATGETVNFRHGSGSKHTGGDQYSSWYA